MKVLVLSNGEFTTHKITDELTDFQKIVGGHIEVPFLGDSFRDNGIDVIINEEGKFIEGMKPEIAVVSEATGDLLDIVYGNCIFASHNEQGETIELNDEQIQIVMDELVITAFVNMRNKGAFKIKALFV